MIELEKNYNNCSSDEQTEKQGILYRNLSNGKE